MKARRTLSILLFLLGGFCVGMEVMAAFMIGPATADYINRTAYFSAIAAVFLVLGTWSSPGQRWRELGLTILLGAAVCVASFSTALFLPDERGIVADTSELEPYLALGAGFTNLALITAAGCILYVRGGGGAHRLIAGFASEALAKLELIIRASWTAIWRN